MPDENEFPSNSKKSKAETTKPEKKPVEQIVTGKVITQQPSMFRRVMATFKGEDMHSVGRGVVFDVVIPAVKNLLADAGIEAIERALWGGDGGSRGKRNRTTGYTDYSAMYKNAQKSSEKKQERQMSYKAKSEHDFSEIVLEDRGQAESIIDRLTELIDTYDQATVADFYDLAGVTKSFADENWGWYGMRGADILRVRGGFLVKLPRPEPLD